MLSFDVVQGILQSWGGWGRVGLITFLCTLHLQKSRCYGQEGGGVGWDNSVIDLAFSCTCTHTSCYPSVRSHALAHIRHAMLLCVLMHLHTYVMRRCCAFSCTCTHTLFYAAVHSHALPHICHAQIHRSFAHKTTICEKTPQ